MAEKAGEAKDILVGMIEKAETMNPMDVSRIAKTIIVLIILLALNVPGAMIEGIDLPCGEKRYFYNKIYIVIALRREGTLGELNLVMIIPEELSHRD